MPSAATRQKIPADLWPSGRQSVGRCSPLQASPVQAEPDEAKARKGLNSPHSKGHSQQRKEQKRQRTASARSGSSCVSQLVHHQRPVSPEIPSVAGRVSPKVTSSGRAKTPDSEAFAMELPPAPHPSCLPLPPMEWLKPKSQSPLTVGQSLQAILTCQLAAA